MYMSAKMMNVEGFEQLVQTEEQAIFLNDVWDEQYEEVMNEYNLEGWGFGSSDMTFLIQSVIDTYLCVYQMEYRTVFDPYLKVVKKKVQ